MGQDVPLTTETVSDHHCEGEVVTCASCGRPLTECDGECDEVLETRGHRLPVETSAIATAGEIVD